MNLKKRIFTDKVLHQISFIVQRELKHSLLRNNTLTVHYENILGKNNPFRFDVDATGFHVRG